MEKTCRWNPHCKYCSGSIFLTECNEIFTEKDAEISDKLYKFCPYCGGKIKDQNE